MFAHVDPDPFRLLTFEPLFDLSCASAHPTAGLPPRSSLLPLARSTASAAASAAASGAGAPTNRVRVQSRYVPHSRSVLACVDVVAPKHRV